LQLLRYSVDLPMMQAKPLLICRCKLEWLASLISREAPKLSIAAVLFCNSLGVQACIMFFWA
jgi:hypothetical protein